MKIKERKMKKRLPRGTSLLLLLPRRLKKKIEMLQEIVRRNPRRSQIVPVLPHRRLGRCEGAGAPACPAQAILARGQAQGFLV